MTSTLFESRQDAAFRVFHELHPEVYELYKRFAFELRAAGHDHGSSEQIIQRIRWETMVNRRHDGWFKINDWFRARYARMLSADYPAEFGKFFQFRKHIVV